MAERAFVAAPCRFPQKFDGEIKELTSSGKLSASKIKAVTELGIANITVRLGLSLSLVFPLLAHSHFAAIAARRAHCRNALQGAQAG